MNHLGFGDCVHTAQQCLFFTDPWHCKDAARGSQIPMPKQRGGHHHFHFNKTLDLITFMN